jgi:hypothetical protein
MPAKKAAKKAAKKPQRKFSDPHTSDDFRLAYEHLGRIEVLEGALVGTPFVDVNVLANLAQQQLDYGHAKNASDLLRAAEHISFAALAPRESLDLSSVTPSELKAAVANELDRLTQSAESQWAESDDAANRAVIENIYTSSLEHARSSFASGAYRPALQFARAAEALSRITGGLPATLPGDRALTRRIAS